LKNKHKNQQVSLAQMEVINEFLLIVMIFFGGVSLFLPVLYYQFLKMRYNSSQNTKMAVAHLKQQADYYSSHPNCPAIIGNFYRKIVGYLSG